MEKGDEIKSNLESRIAKFKEKPNKTEQNKEEKREEVKVK